MSTRSLAAHAAFLPVVALLAPADTKKDPAAVFGPAKVWKVHAAPSARE